MGTCTPPPPWEGLNITNLVDGKCLKVAYVSSFGRCCPGNVSRIPSNQSTHNTVRHGFRELLLVYWGKIPSNKS